MRELTRICAKMTHHFHVGTVLTPRKPEVGGLRAATAGATAAPFTSTNLLFFVQFFALSDFCGGGAVFAAAEEGSGILLGHFKHTTLPVEFLFQAGLNAGVL